MYKLNNLFCNLCRINKNKGKLLSYVSVTLFLLLHVFLFYIFLFYYANPPRWPSGRVLASSAGGARVQSPVKDHFIDSLVVE